MAVKHNTWKSIPDRPTRRYRTVARKGGAIISKMDSSGDSKTKYNPSAFGTESAVRKWFVENIPSGSTDEREKIRSSINNVPIARRPDKDNPSDSLAFLNAMDKRLHDDGLLSPSLQKMVNDYRSNLQVLYQKDITEKVVQHIVTSPHKSLLCIILCESEYVTYSKEYDTNFYKKLKHASSPADVRGYLNDTSVFTFDERSSSEGMLAMKALSRSFDAYRKTHPDDCEAARYALRMERVMKILETTNFVSKVSDTTLSAKQRRVVGRAQRRQLLMLLVGDVPGDLFVDPRTGYVRDGRQISHYILHLLEPYSMSTTTPGSYLYKINKYINVARSFTRQAVEMVAWGLGMLFQLLIMVYSAVLFLASYRPQWLVRYAWTGLTGLFAAVLQTLVKGIITVVERTGDNKAFALRRFSRMFGTVSTIMRTPQEWNMEKHVVTKGLQVLMLGLVTWFLQSIKIDCGKHRRCSVIWYTFQKWSDRQQIFRAATFLAELEPGVFGDHTVSGISDSQMGLMEDVQKLHGELDTYVDNVTPRALTLLMTRYQDTELSEQRQKLWLVMQEVLHMSQTHRIQARAVRQTLLHPKRGFSHEIRGHHIFDQYGYPRRSLDIVKAYFCDWHRQQEQAIHKLPTVPYNSSSIHFFLDPVEWDIEHGGVRRGKTLTPGWFNLNPIQRAEFHRRRHTNPDVRSETIVTTDATDWKEDTMEREALEEKNAETILRNKININQIFKDERNVHMSGWLEAMLPNNPEARDEFRKYSGWAHKLSVPLKKKLIAEFNLSLNLLDEDYQAFIERQAESTERDADFKKPHSRRTLNHHDPSDRGWSSRMEHVWVFDGLVYTPDGSRVERVFTSPTEQSNAYKEFIDSVWEALCKAPAYAPASTPESTPASAPAPAASKPLNDALYKIYEALYKGNQLTIPHLLELISIYGDPASSSSDGNKIKTNDTVAKSFFGTVMYLAAIFLVADHHHRKSSEWFNRIVVEHDADDVHKRYAIQMAKHIFPLHDDWNGHEIWNVFEQFVDTNKIGDFIMRDWYIHARGKVSTKKRIGGVNRNGTKRHGILQRRVVSKCKRRHIATKKSFKNIKQNTISSKKYTRG